MNKINKLLNKYKAKDDVSKTVYLHNNDNLNIKNQIIDIYNIEAIDKKLEKIIIYHDIGKATNSFEEEVLKQRKAAKVRHEVHSASLKCLNNDEKIAILTHHKAIEDLLKYTTNKFYKEELKELSEKLGLEFDDIKPFIVECLDYEQDELLKNLNTILLKGYLNLCDHLGSAGVNKVDKGLNTIEQFKVPNGFHYNSIQRKVLEMRQNPEDVLIMAMTGLGKTATSMYWSDIVQNKEKSKRVYYILPYTASINSLYKDMDSKGVSIAMLHSKAEYFLEKYKQNFAKNDYQYFKKSVKQVNVCTIFQLVKAIFGCKRFEMVLAQMKNSIFIIDEIHCFDTKELSYILEMLRWLKKKLGIRVCVMSASIPTCLQNLIKERLEINTVITANKIDLIKRHKVHRVKTNIIDNLDKIKKHLDLGEKVIVCVNNVSLAQELYKTFEEYKPKMIHGRFNTRDRELAEKGLKEHKGLLIGTQAIEVSLDIDYDVMFTEIAPFDALLQRFGRVNRKGYKNVANIFVYNNSNEYIYQKDIIHKTDRVLLEIIKSDRSIILEDKVNFYLDKVYENVDIQEYEKHKKYIYELIDLLRVGTYNLDATDDMCGSDTISILPKSLYNEFVELVSNKKYLEAESLKVNIRKTKKYIDKDLFEYIEKHRVYIANYKYDSKIGLRFEEDIDDKFL